MNKDRRKFKRFDAYMSIKFKSHDDKYLNGMSLSGIFAATAFGLTPGN
jgi:hypothetical protein